jgi:hypothetical protein
VSLLLGQGNGTFAPSQYNWAGYNMTALTIGDFNGDARPDVAAADGGMNAVSILLNDFDWSDPNTTQLLIRDEIVAEGNTGTVAVEIVVTLSAASTEMITVAYSTANGNAVAGSDYQAVSGTLTIPAGQTAGTITVLVNGDRVAEANETFFVNLSSATGATIADGQGVGTITDDEPRISISDVSKAEGKKGKTTQFTFVVTLSAAYDQPVSLSYQTVNGKATTGNKDYVAKSGAITFAPGETIKYITITIKGDSKRESNEVFYLDLYGLSSNALFTKNRGVGTILNDD